MTSRTRWLLLGFALLGLAFAGGATYVHYRLLTEPNYASPCDISAHFNCSTLYLSRYGSVMGVPVAIGGAFFFVVVALIAGLSGSGRRPEDDATASYVFALSTIGLAAVLYLAWTSYFVLKTGCVLCIGTYVAVLGLFITSGAASAVPMTQLPGRLAADVRDWVTQPVRLVVSLLLVGATAMAVSAFPKASAAGAPDNAKTAPPPTTSTPTGAQLDFDKIWAQQPRVDLGIPAGDAKVVVVKFNDWQCPSCKAAYYAYKPVLDKYAQSSPGAIKVVTKDYPLNHKCNFSVPSQMHPGACEASAAVRLATEQGKTDAMVEWLFANQETLTPQTVEAQAKTLLGTTDFAKEYARLLPDIQRDTADGAALGVAFTPTYYVNGVKAQASGGTWLSAQYFDYALQYELRKSGGKD